jgi:hypothetical protein
MAVWQMKICALVVLHGYCAANLEIHASHDRGEEAQADKATAVVKTSMTIQGLDFDKLTEEFKDKVTSTVKATVAENLNDVTLDDVSVVLSKGSVKADVTVTLSGGTQAALATKAAAVNENVGTNEVALAEGIVTSLQENYPDLIAAAKDGDVELSVGSITTEVVKEETRRRFFMLEESTCESEGYFAILTKQDCEFVAGKLDDQESLGIKGKSAILSVRTHDSPYGCYFIPNARKNRLWLNTAASKSNPATPERKQFCRLTEKKAFSSKSIAIDEKANAQGCGCTAATAVVVGATFAALFS